MELDLHIVALQLSLENNQWDQAGVYLEKIFATVSFEAIDAIDLGVNAVLHCWIDALVLTGSYKSSPKGRYLFMKLIRRLWARADDMHRWDMLSCVASLYEMIPSRSYSEGEAREYFHGLAGLMDIAPEEVLRVVNVHNNDANMCAGYSPVMQ